jgi:hypothetical protein
MPTVGWIREGDLDAFYEGTERTPDPGPPREPGYSCPFCAAHFPSQSEFQDHVYAKHRVERPFILLRGREPSAHAVLRSPLALAEIAITNTSHAKVCLDGALPRQVSTDTLREIIAETSQAELKLELVNAAEQRAAPVVTQSLITPDSVPVIVQWVNEGCPGLDWAAGQLPPLSFSRRS